MKLKTKGRNSNLWLVLFLSGYTILANNLSSIAQIIPDDTLGSEASVVNQINETLQQIDGGALRGENLFHSFLEFSINEGNAVYFSNPADVINIFSRVTGNNISQILGTLGVSGNANLYLLNPNGILFGPNAQLDIAGSFVASSGSGFILPNGLEYSAINPQAPPLLTVNTTAPVGLKLEGSEGIITNQAQLTAVNNLTLAGNQLDLQGQIIAQGDLTLQASNLISIKNGIIDVRGNEGGSINASAKNININNAQVLAGIGEGLGFENAQSGDINFNVAENLTISDSSAIANAVFQFGVGNSGNIIIKTGSLSLQNAGQIFTGIFGLGNAGKVDIKANQGITVEGQTTTGSFNSLISSNVFNGGIGTSAGIEIETTSLSITNGGQIGASVFGEGNAGAIQIKATQEITINGESITDSFDTGIFGTVFGVGTTGGVIIDTGFLSLTNGGQISTPVFGEGNTGGVQIKADEGITIQGESMSNSSFFTGIFSSVGENGIGTSGAIVIDTTTLSLADEGEIGASVFGTGDAGAINIKADQGITIDGEGIVNGETFASGIFSNVQENAIGTTGGIFIDTTNLSLTNGGEIFVGIFGEGDAGVVQIKANEGISIDGETSDGSVNSGIFSNVRENAIGTTGGIFIDTTNLSLINGGQIVANIFGKGDAGVVQIKANEGISIDGETSDGSVIIVSGIFSEIAEDGEGNAGGIDIDTGSLSLTNGGEISAATFDKGDAEAVQIKASEGITVDGEATDGRYSSIFSAGGTDAEGDSKGIVIDTTTLSLTNGAEISTSISGIGEGGEVKITATEGIIIDGETREGNPSGIFARLNDENAVGNSGTIVIDTTTLSLTNGGEITSSTIGTGDAGIVQINASEDIIIDGETSTGILSGIFSQVFSDAVGKSGGIVINTTNLSISNGGRITVNIFGKGEEGNINITNQNLNLNKGTISAETTSGDGGNIKLTVQEFLTLRNNSEISTTAGNQQTGGDGGNINIFARYILAIPEENSDITANAFTGKGGQIFIATEAIFGIEPRDELTFLSDITASSELGVDGIIEITRLNVDPLEGLTNLPSTPAEVKVAQGCEVGGEGSVSFYDLGKGGLPAQPTDFLRIKPIPWIPLTRQTQQQSWNLTETTYSVFPATSPIQFQFSCQKF